jgi:hypothetical protein
MFHEIERQVAMRTGYDHQSQLSQQAPPLSQNRAMHSQQSEVMELSL